LLDLDTLSGSEPPIAEAVALLGDLLGAQLGHVELFPPRGDAIVFEHAHGREAVSREIIQSAVETRTTINIASAVDHPRFRSAPSVIENGIRAVMCTPIGIGAPVGVAYVQGRRAPGRFPDVDRERAELFAAKVACVADRMRFSRDAAKVTLDNELLWLEQRQVRASLDRNRGNLTSTARELGITRARLYRILKRGA
jgi:GAF domain-containing protein